MAGNLGNAGADGVLVADADALEPAEELDEVVDEPHPPSKSATASTTAGQIGRGSRAGTLAGESRTNRGYFAAADTKPEGAGGEQGSHSSFTTG